MATLQAATTSNGAFVTDPQVVRQLCENHCIGTLNWEVDETGNSSSGLRQLRSVRGP